MDKAGRWQYRYSQKHVKEAARRKFERVKSFSRDMPGIRRGIENGIQQNDPRAWLMDLEQKTGIRIGSRTDFKARKKAYGLTTLQHEHLTIKGDKIFLDFTAKEGIPAHYEFVDGKMARWLGGRKAATKPGEMLFPDVTASKFNKYLKELAGGRKYTAKDFRTYLGTRLAYEELGKLSEEAIKGMTKKAKKEVVKNVCEEVSKVLANTPAMAKKSYIDPMVWEIIGGLP
jgi:DNA topoisomerase-1